MYIFIVNINIPFIRSYVSNAYADKHSAFSAAYSYMEAHNSCVYFEVVYPDVHTLPNFVAEEQYTKYAIDNGMPIESYSFISDSEEKFYVDIYHIQTA